MKKKYSSISGILVLVMLFPFGASAVEMLAPSSEPSLHPLKDRLEGKSAVDRAAIKGEALASIGALAKTHRTTYAIAIDSMEPIEGGIEMLARVWDKNDKQIGFGKDGTVDLERFRIFNPPILVEDPKGDIVHQWTNPDTGEQFERHFREDPKEALLQSLERTINAKKERFGDEAIVNGKEGHTTSTFYSSTDDGWTRSNSSEWPVVRSGSGELGNTTDANAGDFRVSEWYSDITAYRYHGSFNTSALGSTTISTASLNLYFSGLAVGAFTSHNGWQVSKSALSGATAATRWDSYTSAMDGVPLSNEIRLGTTDGYVQFALNASGMNAINKFGNTSMGIVSYWDMVNVDPNQPYGGLKNDVGTIAMADTAGTANDPMLVVESTTGGGGGGSETISSSTLQYLTYTYDKLGNIVSIVDQSATQSYGTSTYQYDGLSRLVSATGTTPFLGNYAQSYVYDWLGNLTSKSDQGAYTYAQTGYTNPHAATQIGTTNYTYDQAGNLLTSGNGIATSTYTWDYRGRMSYSIMNGTSSAYTYDSSDQRTSMAVKKGTAATSTTYYWSPQYQTMGATTTMYLYANGNLLATIQGNGKSTTTALSHTDHLGSVVVESSATGTALQTLAYYPYGDTRANQQASVNFGTQKRFLSQFSDDSGLNYLNARYQSGAQGRFVSQDPIARDIALMQKQPAYILMMNGGNGEVDQTAVLSDPQLLNFYSYSANNPITKSDPSGKCLPACAGVFAIPGVGQAAAIGAVAVVGTVAIYTVTNAILQSNGWGQRWAGPVQITDPSRILPKIPQPWDTEPPNINPKAPKWMVQAIGTAMAIDGIVQYAQELKDKVKSVVDSFGEKDSSASQNSNTKNQNAGNNPQTNQKNNNQVVPSNISQPNKNPK